MVFSQSGCLQSFTQAGYSTVFFTGLMTGCYSCAHEFLCLAFRFDGQNLDHNWIIGFMLHYRGAIDLGSCLLKSCFQDTYTIMNDRNNDNWQLCSTFCLIIQSAVAFLPFQEILTLISASSKMV